MIKSLFLTFLFQIESQNTSAIKTEAPHPAMMIKAEIEEDTEEALDAIISSTKTLAEVDRIYKEVRLIALLLGITVLV